MEGPAKIEVVSEMRVVLLRGVVTATIPESAIGFVVDTQRHTLSIGEPHFAYRSETMAPPTSVCLRVRFR